MAHVAAGSLAELALLRVSTVSSLQSYKRKQTGAQTRQKNDLAHAYQLYDRSDLEWVLAEFRPELARYRLERAVRWVRERERVSVNVWDWAVRCGAAGLVFAGMGTIASLRCGWWPCSRTGMKPGWPAR